jgi:hypothetical protein
MTDKPHPIQPVVLDENGVKRFKQNKIVRDLLDYSRERGFGLNEIICRDYPREDREQLAQLIGYSLGGAAELDYMSETVLAAAESADANARRLSAQVARSVIDDLRKQIGANLDPIVDDRVIKAFNWELDYYAERLDVWCGNDEDAGDV